MIGTMIISYPSHHTWTKTLTTDAFAGFGKNHLARLKTTLRKIDTSSVSYSIEPLTPENLEWFIPLYTATVMTKNNPKVNDIFGSTLGKAGSHPYYILIIKENSVMIGATIYATRKTSLSFAYRIYPNKWTQNNLPAGPSLYAEYLLGAWAIENGYLKISHGKDRNPYGINANIGLALFKLSVGCAVELPTGEYEILSLDTDDITTDILVFEQPKDTERKITQAYLYVQKETLAKYESIKKYDHTITTSILARD